MKTFQAFTTLFIYLSLGQAYASECVDTGVPGDGWGWDGTGSCTITIAAGECIDHDGDGWGWDGVNSCLAADLASNDQAFNVAHTGQSSSFQAGDDGFWQSRQFSSTRFVNNNNGTFSDSLTGLTWLGVRDCILERAWNSAIDFANQLSADSGTCAALTDGSLAGEWRLPNINELQTLLDYSRQSPAFSEGISFTGSWDSFPWGRYWSSTSFIADVDNFAWVLFADFGQTSAHNKANVARAFAVRD